MLKEKLLIVCLFVLSFVLRTISLSTIPESLSRDEVSLGYNAYAIATTGKDEYQKEFPLLFQSLNDYKLPVPVYLTAILIKLFGTGDLFIRLPTAFLGSLTPIVVYFILKTITEKKLSMIAAFSLSICPWHIMLSRIMSESVIALFFLSLGVFFLLSNIKKYSLIKTFLSMICFIFSFLSYRTEFIFIPLILLSFIPFVKDRFCRLDKKEKIKNSLIILLFFFAFLFSIGIIGKTRFSEVSIISSPETILNNAESIREETNYQVIVTRVFHNKLISLSKIIAQNYFSHFNFLYLFINGDVNFPENSVPFMGQYYFVDLVFFILGLYFFVRIKDRNFKLFVASWLIIGPLASSLTQGTPNSFRNLVSVVGISSMIALGISKIQNKKILFVLIFAYALNFSFFIHQYIIHRAVQQPWTRDLQLKQLFNYVRFNEKKYDRVYFENYPDLYVFFLYYNLINPNELFLAEKNLNPKSDRIELISRLEPKFTVIKEGECPEELKPKTLYICRGRKSDIKLAQKLVKTFYYPRGSVAFYLLAN